MMGDTDSELLEHVRRQTQIAENIQAMLAFLMVVLALAALVALVVWTKAGG